LLACQRILAIVSLSLSLSLSVFNFAYANEHNLSKARNEVAL